MVESATPRFPEQEREVINMSAGIFQSFVGTGYLIAPLYGSILYSFIGFRLTEDVTACLNIALAIAYFACAGGFNAIKKTYINFRNPEITIKEIN